MQNSESSDQTLAQLQQENYLLRAQIDQMNPDIISSRLEAVVAREHLVRVRLQESQDMLNTSITLNNRSRWLALGAMVIFAFWAIHGLWELWNLVH